MTDITDCALKNVCADCKQQVPACDGCYFSLFFPCRIKCGKVHVCATQVHLECTDTWTYEFEASGHDRLCDKHPFASILPEHIMMELHMQCLAKHLPEEEKQHLIARLREQLTVTQNALSLMSDQDLSVTVKQKKAIFDEAVRLTKLYEKQLSVLEA